MVVLMLFLAACQGDVKPTTVPEPVEESPTTVSEADEEPFVIQVPDFGDLFWAYALYDARTDQFGKMGE